MSLKSEVNMLLDTLRQDCPGARDEDFVSFVAIDSLNGLYNEENMVAFETWLASRGIALLDFRIVFPGGVRHDPEAVSEMLMSLASSSGGGDA